MLKKYGHVCLIKVLLLYSLIVLICLLQNKKRKLFQLFYVFQYFGSSLLMQYFILGQLFCNKKFQRIKWRLVLTQKLSMKCCYLDKKYHHYRIIVKITQQESNGKIIKIPECLYKQ